MSQSLDNLNQSLQDLKSKVRRWRVVATSRADRGEPGGHWPPGLRDVLGCSPTNHSLPREVFPPLTCPKCRATLSRSVMRPRQVSDAHGEVHYERALYECPDCRRSYAPLDAELGLLPMIA